MGAHRSGDTLQNYGFLGTSIEQQYDETTRFVLARFAAADPLDLVSILAAGVAGGDQAVGVVSWKLENERRLTNG